jgi:hypothetical protein
MKQVWGISSASGGSWASVPYTFLPENISGKSFLGGVVPNPSDLTWSVQYKENPDAALDYLPSFNLGEAAKDLGMIPMFKKALELIGTGLQPSEAWPMMIGSLILEPFGLYKGDKSGQSELTFTWKEQTFKEDVEALNQGVPTLRRENFRTVERNDRPFLIVNSALVPNKGKVPLLPYEITPLSVGVPGFHAEFGPGERDLGGGGISPFALGTVRAIPDSKNTAFATKPLRLFSLADMAGISSVAPGEMMQVKLPELDSMLPTNMVWPVKNFNSFRNAAWPYLFSDGGNLDNTAVIALLRRPLRRICSFINCATPLEKDSVTRQVIVDSMLPPLFGFQPHVTGKPYQRYPENSSEPLLDNAFEVYRHNQVFPAEQFIPMVNNLWIAATSGGAAMFQQTDLPVLSNEWFGVKGGQEVDVLWTYNFPSTDFVDQLAWPIRLAMKLPFIGLRDFPYYKTAAQLKLHERQINLLAHLAAWGIVGGSEAGHPGEKNFEFVKAFFEVVISSLMGKIS